MQAHITYLLDVVAQSLVENTDTEPDSKMVRVRCDLPRHGTVDLEAREYHLSFS